MSLIGNDLDELGGSLGGTFGVGRLIELKREEKEESATRSSLKQNKEGETCVFVDPLVEGFDTVDNEERKESQRAERKRSTRRDSRLPHVLPVELLDDSFEDDFVVLRVRGDVAGRGRSDYSFHTFDKILLPERKKEN